MKKQFKILGNKDHALLRPNMYIGNTNTYEKEQWYVDIEEMKLVYKSIPENQGYQKLINEVLDNSVGVFMESKGVYANQ